MQIFCKDTNEIANSYAEYLTTRHWKILREKAFLKANGICCCCKKSLKNKFICHHRNYDRVGNERIRTAPYSANFFVRCFQKLFLDDVIVVCCHCHNGASETHIKLHRFVRVPKWARVNRQTEKGEEF